jgi:hypothetical protein
MSKPQPATSHHPGWLAVAKRMRSVLATTAIAPTIATPSDWPTWRLVEATAEATPACAGGMPDTAVFVIGGLTEPKPTPKMT